MTDAEATLGDLPRLLVPIDVQALLVSDSSLEGNEWLDLMPDFKQLFQRKYLGSQFEPDVSAVTDSLHDPGVHLHWALPDALCRGEAKDEGLELPAIPNRWLILRLVPPKDSTTKDLGLRAWIVESDYVTSPDVKPEPPMTGNAWPSPRLRQSAGSTKKQDYYIKVGKAFTYDGQGPPETQWKDANSPTSLAQTDASFAIKKLTAIGYGDPAFCASYPACRYLLGFHDPVDDGVPAGASKTNPVVLTYLVAGWYANPADDPLHGCTAQDWKSRLEKLRWKTPDPVPEPPNPTPAPAPTPPDQILCHGLIQGVKWQGGDTKYPVQDTSSSVAVGNNDVEALTAFLGASYKELAAAQFADLFAAFQFNVLTGLAQPGGDHELTASLHERSFGRYPGGLRWEIMEPPRAAAPAPGGTDRSGKETVTVVPERIGRALRQLNDAQRLLDSTEQTLRSYQEEIYATWYKAFLASDDDDLEKKWAPSLQGRLQWLRNQISAGRIQIGQQRQTCVARQDELKAELKVFLPGFQLQVGSEPYFHAPNDPVVLISGGVARVSRRHGEDGRYSKDGKTLLCRLEDQAISSWTVTAPRSSQDVRITAADLPGSAGFPKGRPIPRAIAERLFPEALLLEPGLTWRLAEVAATKGDDNKDRWKPTLDRVLTLLGEESRNKDNDGVPPRDIWILDQLLPDGGRPVETPKPQASDLGRVQWDAYFPSAVALNLWSQNPWLPLHLIWEVQWHAFASEPKAMLGGSNLDPDRIAFTFPSNGGTTSAGSYQGLTVLTPGGTVNLKSRLRERLDYAPSDELRTIYEKICQTDVLSQSLAGLTEQLVMKKMRPELALLDPETAIPGFEAGGIQQDLAPVAAGRRFDPVLKISPEPPLPRDPGEAAFFPIRAGTLELVRLDIVDAFGRMRKLVIDDTMRGSPRLTPPGPGGPRPPRFFLEPRLSAPARLVMQWRNPAAADKPAVCGWLLPNILDRSFVVLDALGRALGMLQRQQPDLLKMGSGQKDALQGKGFFWVPVPPMKRPANPADPLPDHPYLGGFIRSLLALQGESAKVYDPLFSGLEATQGGLNRPSSARSPNVAALLGRPLALVRASLRLEFAGLGPLAQAWDKLNILDPKEGMLGLDKVEFPVVLGHPVPGLDGLVGYFLPDDSYRETDVPPYFQTLYMAHGLEGRPADPAFGNFHVKYKSSAQQKVAISRPLELLLLMYPEGGVTVTTGILPRQTFQPETSDGGADLEESDVYFYTGPVVSPEAELRIPQPSDAYGQWSWTHRQAIDIWAPEEALDGKDKKTEPPSQDLLQLREGWLKLVAYPLAIHDFRVEGLEPRKDLETPTPLRFVVPKGDNGYVLAWTVSGADGVVLRREGRSDALFESLIRPHPARYFIEPPQGDGEATYTLAASRADGALKQMTIVVTSTGK